VEGAKAVPARTGSVDEACYIRVKGKKREKRC
jgi:hypothetical protein